MEKLKKVFRIGKRANKNTEAISAQAAYTSGFLSASIAATQITAAQ